MILRRKPSEWLESSVESDLGMRLAMWNLDLALRDFAFLKQSFLCKIFLAYFRDSETEIFIVVIRDPLFFPFVNRARGSPTPSRSVRSSSMKIVYEYTGLPP